MGETRGVAIDLSRLGPRPLGAVIAALGAQASEPIPCCPVGEGVFSEALGALGQAARVARIEHGIDDLAVGFPWIEGRTPEGTPVRAPLFIYPATLEPAASGHWQWLLQISGAPWLNEALAAHFRRMTRVRLTYEDFLAHDEDGLFKADDPTWQGLTKTLNRAGVTLADTSATLPEKPSRFDRYDEKAMALIPPGQFRLQHQVVLARLSMLEAGVTADIESVLGSPLDAFTLAGAATLLDVDPQNPGSAGRAPARAADDRGAFGALRRWQVLPTDPWQEDALRVMEGIKEGGLCVVGPPGTGKSQLVANLIAASIQRGDRVLFASAGRGALDDVHQRLSDRGLGEPLAMVLDPWRDRGPLCTSLYETLDPIVNTLDEVKSAAPESEVVSGLERTLHERISAADQAYDVLAGTDQRYLGLALIDEHALVDPIDQLPDLTDDVEGVSPHDLEQALDDIQQLAPHAAEFVTPHPLALRTDWAELDDAAVRAFYDQVARARKAIAAWSDLSGPLLPVELDRLRPVIGRARPMVELALCDDPERLRIHAEVRQWLDDSPAPTDEHRQFVAELRAEAAERTAVPAELVALAPAELAQRIANLDKLHKHETSGLRVFTPAYWSLKKLPEKYLATLPPETPKEAAPLAALHREAAAWQKLVLTLPDLPAFALAEVGDPDVLMAMVERLEKALEEADAEALLVESFGPRVPSRPDWVGAPPYRRAMSPFLTGVAEEQARKDALAAVYAALEPLEPHIAKAWYDEVRVFARDVPHEAEERLAAVAGTRAEGPKVALLDRTTAPLLPFVGRFLRLWSGPPELAVRACRRAVEEGWRNLRIKAWGGSGIEAALVDPRELRALAETMSQLEDARAVFAAARWRERLGALMDVEAQRQDLTKIISEVGRKRMRATLKQLVDRHWKRGLAQLRPVWLVPLDAVASIFPRDRDTFDLIIIDEAQRASVDAVLPALFRGRRMLFLGDPLQAPPRPLIPGASEPSALSVAMGAFPTTSLRWGWGVRRDEMWELPNAGWYADTVQLAPDCEKRELARSEGLHWLKVDGRWKDGENQAEADKVVERIADVLSDKIGEFMPSVGVVTGTRAQALLIRALIDKKAAHDESFRALLRADRERPENEQLVVGDLEEVPPDARDILIMSLAWAPPEGSKRVQLELGQLLAPDGDGILSGVIARARYGIHLIASFHDAAIDATRRPELGAKLLAGFMAHTYGVAQRDERIIGAALADVATATGITVAAPEPMAGVGDVVRERIAEEFGERGLGISLEPLPGPVAPDMTLAPTPKSAARVAIQSTRFMLEPDTFVRDLWARRFWQRQGWVLIRVTPGVWRSSPIGVVRAIEKLFSMPARLDERMTAAAETRARVEKLRAEYEAARAFELLSKQAAERAAIEEAARAEREAQEAIERAAQEAQEEAERVEREAREAQEAAERAEREAQEAAEHAEREAQEARSAPSARRREAGERVAAEQAAMAEAERLAAEAAEAERVAAEQAAEEAAGAEAEAERAAAEQAAAAEAERLAAEEAAAAYAARMAAKAAADKAESAARVAAHKASLERAAAKKAAAEKAAAEAAAAEAAAAEQAAAAKVEAAKVEAAKVEAAKVEAAKVEAAKVEPVVVATPAPAPALAAPAVAAAKAPPAKAIAAPPAKPIARPPSAPIATAPPIAKAPLKPPPIAAPPAAKAAVAPAPAAPAAPAPAAPAAIAPAATATAAPAPIAPPPTALKAPLTRPPIAAPAPIAKAPAPIAKVPAPIAKAPAPIAKALRRSPRRPRRPHRSLRRSRARPSRDRRR
ncbi:MAG: hypothetical protein U1F43_14940 [Myxococcota bacterium]